MYTTLHTYLPLLPHVISNSVLLAYKHCKLRLTDHFGDTFVLIDLLIPDIERNLSFPMNSCASEGLVCYQV